MGAIIRCMALLVVFQATPWAHAQVYRCSSGGSTYLSDRPCPVLPKTQLGGYGPVAPGTYVPYSAPLPDAPRAQDHVKYLGSACASISEAIRTGPTRGVRADVIRGLQEEYSQKCSVEDQEARRQAQQDKAQELQGKLAERDNNIRERQQVKARLDYCTGMRDVIGLKRKRESALNAAEVEALRNLEKAYSARCIGQ
jgi:hypothetical protein